MVYADYEWRCNPEFEAAYQYFLKIPQWEVYLLPIYDDRSGYPLLDPAKAIKFYRCEIKQLVEALKQKNLKELEQATTLPITQIEEGVVKFCATRLNQWFTPSDFLRLDLAIRKHTEAEQKWNGVKASNIVADHCRTLAFKHCIGKLERTERSVKYGIFEN